MKHIVIVGKYYPPQLGGIERYTRDVANATAKAHRVTVIAHNIEPADRIEQDGAISVVRCGTKTTISSQPVSPSMLAHMRSLQPDLVHFHAPNFWAAGMLQLARWRAPLVITHHADVFGRPLIKHAVLPIYRRLVRRAACVVVNSLRNVTTSHDLVQNAAPFVEVPWGVDPGPYRLDESVRAGLMTERRRRFADAPVIGFLGRFVRYKGLSTLMKALSRLENHHAILIGDGPLRPQVTAQADALGIAQRVHFLGNLDEQAKIRALAMTDLLAFPSTDTTEAFGVAQIEAQMLGLPVIASDLPTGVTQVTLAEKTGLLVRPGDPDSLASAIARLINDPELARKLGHTARERALEIFSLSAFEDRFARLFETVLAGKPLGELCNPVLESSPAGRAL